jgi:para-nitrobenzyl esterase
MVWLHGGGFHVGSGSATLCYDGAALARRGGVVHVSVNHRLGALGYLYLRELAGEDFTRSGNAGLLDLVQALEWVRDNVAAFGGDPGSVTIFGQSGGGGKVSYLLAMPAAKGLFHRAIIMSGPRLRAILPDEATSNARSLLGELGLSQDKVRKLQEVPAQRLFEAQSALSRKRGDLVAGRGGLLPVLDGETLPRHPFAPDATSVSVGVPLMIGSTRDEQSYVLLGQPNYVQLREDELTPLALKVLRDRPDRVSLGSEEQVGDLVAAYRRLRPTLSPRDLITAIASDTVRAASVRIAERRCAAGSASTFMYLFTLESKARDGLLKSVHTIDLPFVFDNVDLAPDLGGTDADARALAAKVSMSWASFARSGSPEHEGLPAWPAYQTTDRSTMVFDRSPALAHDPFGDTLSLWEGIV